MKDYKALYKQELAQHEYCNKLIDDLNFQVASLIEENNKLKNEAYKALENRVNECLDCKNFDYATFKSDTECKIQELQNEVKLYKTALEEIAAAKSDMNKFVGIAIRALAVGEESNGSTQ